MFLHETTTLSSSATCLVSTLCTDRSAPWHSPHSFGMRCSSGMFVSSLRVSPGWPTALPGGLHAGCRVCRALMAFLRRYSAAHVPLRDGEWGLLWYRSLAASFLFSSHISDISDWCLLIFSFRAGLPRRARP